MTPVRKPSLSRRDLLLAAAGVACGGCNSTPNHTRPSPSAKAQAARGWHEESFAATATATKQHAAMLLVPGAPILVALHGRGEAGRGLTVGARGWRDDYDLDHAHQRLQAPPLTKADFHGFVTAERLTHFNNALKTKAYRGLTVACPYTPIVRDRSAAGARPFATFLRDRLVARTRTLGDAAKMPAGIDGVSMGGRLALLIGLSYPELFTTVGAMQPAIGVDEADELAALAQRAVSKHGTKLRLLSSLDDPFLDAVTALSRALAKRSVDHQLVVTPGPHDYVYNRGPGAYEMLLWHERSLRGLDFAAPPLK